VAIIDRGSWEYGTKFLIAKQAIAIASIVFNNQGNEVMTIGEGADGSKVAVQLLLPL